MTPAIFDNDNVRSEYMRWVSHFGDEDPYRSPHTVGLHEVLRAHFFVVDYFYSKGKGIGGIGPKDPNRLHSALYRQFVCYGSAEKWKTPYEKAATLLFGLITDHPFHDANKRTGLLTLLLFLVKMGRTSTVKQRILEDLAVRISSDSLNSYSRYRQYRKRNHDPEISFIADYIKRYSRTLDNRYYAITYRELGNLLRNFGYKLNNPSGNHIDVIRVESRRKHLGFGPREQVDVKVAQIGFPGWKSQVGKGAIATVRRETKLTVENGVDSKSFYKGADPIHSLIAQYAGPLERLASR